jgi:hypothetical protein
MAIFSAMLYLMEASSAATATSTPAAIPTRERLCRKTPAAQNL